MTHEAKDADVSHEELKKREISAWLEFAYETNLKTRFLFHAINGLAAHHHQLSSLGMDRSGVDIFPVTGLCCRPSMSMESFVQHTARGGAIEQWLLKAWIVEIYQLWEDRYRKDFCDLAGIRDTNPGVIRPQMDPLGDLRLIRNDLVHGAKPKADESARCTVLRWFKKGEKIGLGLHHVLDFINQMNWLGSVSLPDGRHSMWDWNFLHGGQPDPDPRIVSVRPQIFETAESKAQLRASVVFRDGVFGGIVFPMPAALVKTLTPAWSKLQPTQRGDRLLLSPPSGWIIADAKDLYQELLAPDGQKIPGGTRGPVMWTRSVDPEHKKAVELERPAAGTPSP